MENRAVELDGSMGEGGGQILRSSLTLSLLTGRPFHLVNVRANRSRPGLQPQHLMSVQAAARIGQARVTGAARGSRDLTFHPGPVRPGHYSLAIGTAGATGLVLQTIALPLALAAGGPSEVTIEGGTHTTTSPCYHFLATTWCAYLDLLGVRLRLDMLRPGFYPRGGGAIHAHVDPTPALRPLNLLRRGPVRLRGISAVAGLPDHVRRRQARRATFRLEQAGHDVTVEEQNWPGGPGSVLALVVETSPAPALFLGLGARGKPAEAVADEAVDQALAFLDTDPAAVDPHSGDQLILSLALAPGPSVYTVSQVTSHLRTNADVIRAFLDRTVRIDGAEGRPGTVYIS